MSTCVQLQVGYEGGGGGAEENATVVTGRPRGVKEIMTLFTHRNHFFFQSLQRWDLLSLCKLQDTMF